jgi:hypothetical protein
MMTRRKNGIILILVMIVVYFAAKVVVAAAAVAFGRPFLWCFFGFYRYYELLDFGRLKMKNNEKKKKHRWNCDDDVTPAIYKKLIVNNCVIQFTVN